MAPNHHVSWGSRLSSFPTFEIISAAAVPCNCSPWIGNNPKFINIDLPKLNWIMRFISISTVSKLKPPWPSYN